MIERVLKLLMVLFLLFVGVPLLLGSLG